MINVFKKGEKIAEANTLPEAMNAVAKDANVSPRSLSVGRPYGISIDVHAGDNVYRLDNPPQKGS
jgi:hypothetical protein